ncbi:MAG: hypothetical protein ABI615_04925 [Chthoniobacterales bacterium]
MADPEKQKAVFEYVFEQEVKASKVDRYYAWSDQLHALASRQPGFIDQERHLAEEEGPIKRFQTILKFDTAEHCISWLDNPERRRLLNREEEEADFSFRGHGNWEGYSRWLSRSITSEPPKWKVNLLVVLTLYPMAMLLTPLLHFLFKGYSMPSLMLISNFLCVAATSWVLVPFVSRFYMRWLEGGLTAGGRLLVLASLIILLALLLMTFQALPIGFWG